MLPDEQMRHTIKDMNIVSHGRFPIQRPKLQMEKVNIKSRHISKDNRMFIQ